MEKKLENYEEKKRKPTRGASPFNFDLLMTETTYFRLATLSEETKRCLIQKTSDIN